MVGTSTTAKDSSCEDAYFNDDIQKAPQSEEVAEGSDQNEEPMIDGFETASEEGEEDSPNEESHEQSDSERVKRSLKVEAQSVQHKILHRRALDDCEACRVGKTRQQRRKSRWMYRKPTERGDDRGTMDVIQMKDWFGEPGVGGFTDIFNYLDEHHGCVYPEPIKCHDSLTVVECLKHIQGDQQIKRIYSDSAPEFKRACKNLQIMWEPSTPGIHNSNAKIERKNLDLEADVRTALFEAGLLACWWPYAVWFVTFLSRRATSVNEEGHFVKSAWQSRYDTVEHWGGKALPLGCGVFFKPSPTKWSPSKAAPRLAWGILLGYKNGPGDLWSGEYLVFDLDDFVHVDLSVDAAPQQFNKLRPHHTRQIFLPRKQGKNVITFPLKNAYDCANMALERRREAKTI